jgi:hypothetical protein
MGSGDLLAAVLPRTAYGITQKCLTGYLQHILIEG